MKTYAYEWLTKDNVRLHGKFWLTEGQPRAAICLVHGIGEHLGRYEEWAARFAEAGISTTAIDLRGHGLSQGRRGDAKHYTHLLEDLRMMMQKAREYFPPVPTFLYGQSMGGNIAANYALRCKHQLTGLILSSPWLRLSMPVPPAKLTAGKLMRFLWPGLQFSTGLDKSHFSHDEDHHRELDEDPLMHGKISARLFFAMQKAAEYAMGKADKLPCPTLVLHGTKDRIADIGASRELAKKAGQKAEFKAWEENYHILHFDMDKEKVFDYIVNWIESQNR